MPYWTGRINVTIEVDGFDAASERDAEDYVEMNWNDFLYRSTVEYVEVDMEEDDEEVTNIPGIEE